VLTFCVFCIGGALRDLVGGDAEVVDLSKTRDRYFIPTVGKFGGKFNCDVGVSQDITISSVAICYINGEISPCIDRF
jgi:hypothetical protein